MAKKVSDSQVAGIKAHAEAKNKETIKFTFDFLCTKSRNL